MNPDDQPSPWSTRLGSAPPLSLDTLRQAWQRFMICALCGRQLGYGPIIGAARGTFVHARCPDEEESDP